MGGRCAERGQCRGELWRNDSSGEAARTVSSACVTAYGSTQDVSYLRQDAIPIAIALRVAVLATWVVLLWKMAYVRFSMRRLESTLALILSFEGVSLVVLIIALFSISDGPRTGWLGGNCVASPNVDTLTLYIMCVSARIVCVMCVGRFRVVWLRVARPLPRSATPCVQGAAELGLCLPQVGFAEYEVSGRGVWGTCGSLENERRSRLSRHCTVSISVVFAALFLTLSCAAPLSSRITMTICTRARTHELVRECSCVQTLPS